MLYYNQQTQTPLSSIKIGLLPNHEYLFHIDWGDGTKNEFGDVGEIYHFTTGTAESACYITHTYSISSDENGIPSKLLITDGTINTATGASEGLSARYTRYTIRISSGLFPGFCTQPSWRYQSTTVNYLSNDGYNLESVNSWAGEGFDVYRNDTYNTGWSFNSFDRNLNLKYLADNRPIRNFEKSVSMNTAWRSCVSLTTFPVTGFPAAIDFRSAWQGCSSLTNFPLISCPEAVEFPYAWQGCISLTAFSDTNFPNAIVFNNAWRDCTSLSSFSLISCPKATDFSNAWNTCSSLLSFPAIDFPEAADFRHAWQNCFSLLSFSPTAFPLADTFYSAWYNCISLRTFPLISCPKATNFSSAWLNCYSLSTFPAIDFPETINFIYAWGRCSSLTDFPLISCPNAIYFGYAWSACTSLTSFPEIPFPTGRWFNNTWAYCRSLSSFPLFITNSNFLCAVDASEAWNSCYHLKTFPATNFPHVTSLVGTWQNCYTLTQMDFLSAPACKDFRRAWVACGQYFNEYPTALTAFNASPDTFSNMISGDCCFDRVRLTTPTWNSILTSLKEFNTNEYGIFDGGLSQRLGTGTAALYELLDRGWTIKDGGLLFDFGLEVAVPFALSADAPLNLNTIPPNQ